MQVRIISSKEEIAVVDEHEKFVHFAFRPSMKDILELIKTAPNVVLIEIPESYNATISRGLNEIFDMKGITLVVADVWGHRTDICEYADVPTQVIKDLSEEGISVRDISIQTRISESLVSYILK